MFLFFLLAQGLFGARLQFFLAAPRRDGIRETRRQKQLHESEEPLALNLVQGLNPPRPAGQDLVLVPAYVRPEALQRAPIFVAKSIGRGRALDLDIIKFFEDGFPGHGRNRGCRRRTRPRRSFSRDRNIFLQHAQKIEAALLELPHDFHRSNLMLA
jgi:hypothetical protein